MKRLIILIIVLLPFFGFSQNINNVDTLKGKSDTLKFKIQKPKVILDSELDEEYTERPFKGKEEELEITPFIGLTDHETYNLKLKMISRKVK